MVSYIVVRNSIVSTTGRVVCSFPFCDHCETLADALCSMYVMYRPPPVSCGTRQPLVVKTFSVYFMYLTVLKGCLFFFLFARAPGPRIIKYITTSARYPSLQICI